MKYKSFLLALLLSALCIQLGVAQVKEKKEKKVKYDFEMNDQVVLDDAVVKLLPKGAVLVHQVTQGIYGPADGTMGPNINVIYRVGKKNPELMVLIPVEAGKYKKINAGRLDFSKATTGQVYAVFFAQADNDEARELFVLCETFKKGSEAGEIMTAVFDWKKNGFKRMTAIEAKLKGIYPSINVKRALPGILGKK